MDIVVPVIGAITALVGAVSLLVKALRASNLDVWRELRLHRKWRRQAERVIHLYGNRITDLGAEPGDDIVRAEDSLEKIGAELDGGPVE